MRHASAVGADVGGEGAGVGLIGKLNVDLRELFFGDEVGDSRDHGDEGLGGVVQDGLGVVGVGGGVVLELECAECGDGGPELQKGVFEIGGEVGGGFGGVRCAGAGGAGGERV